jgi:hypothetical protein
MRLRGQFSANKVPFAPDYFVSGLYVLEAQSEYAWCLKIQRGVESNAYAALGCFCNQAILRWRRRLGQDFPYVLNGPARRATSFKRERDDVGIPMKRTHTRPITNGDLEPVSSAD